MSGNTERTTPDFWNLYTDIAWEVLGNKLNERALTDSDVEQVTEAIYAAIEAQLPQLDHHLRAVVRTIAKAVESI